MCVLGILNLLKNHNRIYGKYIAFLVVSTVAKVSIVSFYVVSCSYNLFGYDFRQREYALHDITDTKAALFKISSIIIRYL